MFPRASVNDRDREFLAELADRVLERVEDREPVDIDELLVGREHLRKEAERIVSLVYRTSVVQPCGQPVIAGYTILEELGTGGMATVYLARQERVGGRLVALKVLPQSSTFSPTARHRFLEETSTLARADHPHVVTIHDVIADDNTLAYAMEYVEGGTVADLIEALSANPEAPNIASLHEYFREPLAVSDCPTVTIYFAKLVVTIAEAVHQMHTMGLLHRDIKPSNILLRPDGSPLLSDFGLVKDLESPHLTTSGQFLGSMLYASPEQLRGENAKMGPAADVYSLGATLYHALASRPSITYNSPAELIDRAVSGQVRLVRKYAPWVSQDVQTIVHTAMDPDLRRRYGTAREFAQDLRRALELRPILAKPTGVVARMAKFARRNRAGTVATMISVTTIVAATLTLAYALLVPRWVSDYRVAAEFSLLRPALQQEVATAVHWGVRPRSLEETILGQIDRELR